MSSKVIFLASFPAIQSAIKITGDGTGMRIQLDIPESDMPEAIKLMLYRQCVLKITIEPITKTAPVIQKPKSEEDLLTELLDDNPNL